MKTRHIFGMLGVAFMMAGSQSCSDNLDSGLVPTQATLELTVDGHDAAFTLNCNAAPGNYEVEVASNTLWKVEAVSDGGWCSVDKVSGRGTESFTISVRDNMLTERTGSVTVSMVDAQGETLQGVPGSSITITVHQDVSSVRLSPSTLEPFKPSDNERTQFTVTANVAWTLDVTYEGDNATGFVYIMPDQGIMESVGDGTFTGEGEASFYMSLADNRTAGDRKAYINLRSDVGSYSVEITQTKSDYTFDVTPAENRVVGAEGGSIAFGVLSIVGWSVNTAADWITFSVPSYAQGSDSRVETVATVAPNSDGVERSAIVRFQPADERYQELSVTVTQRGYDLAFAISRSDTVGVVSEKGDLLSMELDSRFRWTAEAPSWLNVNPGSGNASSTIQKISVSVDSNLTGSNRTGSVTLTPQPSEFAGGVTLDPSTLGIEALHMSVTQFGGREAAISTPWLRDGYSEYSATIEFNFYSPFQEIVEAGIELDREQGGDPRTLTQTPSNGTDCTVSILFDGLEPATRYVARGYVKNSEGTVKYGDWSFPFTTAGRIPGSEENPTPTD